MSQQRENHIYAAPAQRRCENYSTVIKQRPSPTECEEVFCLHGLNAVHLEKFGWYRIDARGNKPGIDAQFCPPFERLAYTPESDGEADLPGILSEPLAIAVDALKKWKSHDELYRHLPDLKIK